jgi:hypothetical protein
MALQMAPKSNPVPIPPKAPKSKKNKFVPSVLTGTPAISPVLTSKPTPPTPPLPPEMQRDIDEAKRTGTVKVPVHLGFFHSDGNEEMHLVSKFKSMDQKNDSGNYNIGLWVKQSIWRRHQSGQRRIQRVDLYAQFPQPLYKLDEYIFTQLPIFVDKLMAQLNPADAGVHPIAVARATSVASKLESAAESMNDDTKR